MRFSEGRGHFIPVFMPCRTYPQERRRLVCCEVVKLFCEVVQQKVHAADDGVGPTGQIVCASQGLLDLMCVFVCTCGIYVWPTTGAALVEL